MLGSDVVRIISPTLEPVCFTVDFRYRETVQHCILDKGMKAGEDNLY